MKDIHKQVSHVIPEEKTPNEDRLVMLCDGVFAIAVTLLVLDIGIPQDLRSADQVANALETLIAPGIIYLMTFLIIAIYWRFHRSLMQVVQRLDNTFLSLTFLFLAFIAIFPATFKLMGVYGGYRLIAVIYTLGLSGCGFSALALWLYATRNHRLVSPDLSQEEINTRTISLLINPLIYCASLLLLLWVPEGSAYLICFSWALIGFTQRIARDAYKRWLAKPVRELMHHEHNNVHSSKQTQPAETLPATPVNGVLESPAEKKAE